MLNKVILIGNITKDVELMTTTSGISVCRFTLAVNRKFKNSEGNYDTDFIPCKAFRKTAEFLSKYTKKGQQISVVGSIQTGNYEKDGQKYYTTDIIVDEVGFVGNKSNNTSESKSDSDDLFKNMDGFMPMPNDDDMPF